MAKIKVRNAAIATFTALIVCACSESYKNHGFVPDEEELSILEVGADTRASVDEIIGAPGVSGLNSDDYYYIRSRISTYGPRKPKVVDREIVVISFNSNDTIESIERFGLEDGNIVRFSRRVTDSSVVGTSILRQLFGNFGNIDPSEAFGN